MNIFFLDYFQIYKTVAVLQINLLHRGKWEGFIKNLYCTEVWDTSEKVREYERTGPFTLWLESKHRTISPVCATLVNYPDTENMVKRLPSPFLWMGPCVTVVGTSDETCTCERKDPTKRMSVGTVSLEVTTRVSVTNDIFYCVSSSPLPSRFR